MIAYSKAMIKRHWPRLGLRAILLSTLILVATMPGFGALFLRIYENTLVRQTERELMSQGATLAAATAVAWPGFRFQSANGFYRIEPRPIDLRRSHTLAVRPAPSSGGLIDPAARIAAMRIAPVLTETVRTTEASIILMDRRGRIASGRLAGRSYIFLPEVGAALRGIPVTTLRHIAGYKKIAPVSWLSASAGLSLHHARPVVVNDRVVGVMLLSRPPPPLYMGLYADSGKIFIGFMVILGVVIVLSRVLSRGIIRPIEQLGAATRDLARGLAVDVPTKPELAAVEIQSLYTDFAAMAASIESRSRYLRDFAHAISHEFKTPLAGIRGAVELLQDHYADMSDGDRRRFLGNAAVDAERLALLVTRLLELARADMTPAGSESSRLLLIFERLADAYSRSDFSIALLLPHDLPSACAPAATIETVVGSLIDNSRRAGAKSCTISATVQPGRIRLDITDDGLGIAAADRERLFEPFFTTRRGDGGTGLGLPIARSLLDACNGTIGLGETNKGAHFIVQLPVG